MCRQEGRLGQVGYKQHFICCAGQAIHQLQQCYCVSLHSAPTAEHLEGRPGIEGGSHEANILY